ncbi:MAG: hypothetical protein AB1478_06440 [Nitrospirota bacterium]
MFFKAAHDLKVILESRLGKHQGCITAYPLWFIKLKDMGCIKLELTDLRISNGKTLFIPWQI